MAGQLVDVEAFLSTLRSGDRHAEDLLVRQLLLDKQAGDQRGLGMILLVRAYTPAGLAHLARELPFVPAQAREQYWYDALHELWRTIERFDPSRSALPTWLANLVRWQRPRHSGQGTEEGPPLVEVLMPDIPDMAAPDPGPAGSATEPHEQLERVVARLNPQQRALILMRFREQLSYPEISSKLGGTVQPAALRVRMHRILSRIRDSIGR